MTEQAFDRVAELERLAALPDEEQEEKKDDAPAPEKEEEAPADKEPVDDAEDDGEDEEEEPAPEEKPADKAVSPQHARIKAKQEREQLRREVDELKRQLQEKTAPAKEPEVQKQEREVDLSVFENLDEKTLAALREITNVHAEDLARLQESVAPVIANKRTQEIMQRIDVDGEAYNKQHSLPADWLINYTMSVYHATKQA